MKCEIEILPAFAWLSEPGWRYYVCKGGRGKGAGWNMIRQHIVSALTGKRLILCTREIQKSIKESTHRLLESQIDILGLRKFFDIGNESIKCLPTGSEFIFEGLFRNVNKIKSMEDVDIVDCEEAENISDHSWNTLLPTIRKPGSKIYVRFNTAYSDDPTFKRFITNQPPNAIVRHVNFDQNPYFSKELRDEMEQDKIFRPDIVQNKWYGEPLGKGRRVWPGFKKDIHVKDISMDYIRDKGVCFMAQDPAMHYYPACVWGAVLPFPDAPGHFVHIYSEWPDREALHNVSFAEARKKMLFTGSILDLATAFNIAGGTNAHQLKIKDRFIDTRFAKGTGSGSYFSGYTVGIISEFAKQENGGMIFNCPFEKTIDAQRMVINEALKTNVAMPLGPMNQPHLTFAPCCKNMIESMELHRLEEDSERQSETYKDMSDALRILFAGIADYKYQDPNEPDPMLTFAAMASGGGSGSWMG